jgi:hypothetical protein
MSSELGGCQGHHPGRCCLSCTWARSAIWHPQPSRRQICGCLAIVVCGHIVDCNTGTSTFIGIAMRTWTSGQFDIVPLLACVNVANHEAPCLVPPLHLPLLPLPPPPLPSFSSHLSLSRARSLSSLLLPPLLTSPGGIVKRCLLKPPPPLPPSFFPPSPLYCIYYIYVYHNMYTQTPTARNFGYRGT